MEDLSQTKTIWCQQMKRGKIEMSLRKFTTYYKFIYFFLSCWCGGGVSANFEAPSATPTTSFSPSSSFEKDLDRCSNLEGYDIHYFDFLR